MRYYVFSSDKCYGRCIEAKNSFDARRVLANISPQSDVTDFYAVAEPLMKPADWKRWNQIENKV